MTNVPGQRGNTLRLRLALAFLGVALGALALLAVLAAVFSPADVSSLANHQRAALATAFAVRLAVPPGCARGAAPRRGATAPPGPVRAGGRATGASSLPPSIRGPPLSTPRTRPAGT